MATLKTISVLYLVLSIILVFEGIAISTEDNVISYDAMRANHAWGCSPKYPQFYTGRDLPSNVVESHPQIQNPLKTWRSILESRRRNISTKQMIMAVGERNRIPQGFQGDEEVEMIVYLQCDVTSRPSLPCDGLFCIPVPGWVNVFNPSTEELLRFSSGRDPPIPRYANNYQTTDCVFDVFPGYWRMGFGRDNVSGSYKIVRMCFNHHWEIHRCEILDVNIGRWQKLSPPPYEIGYRRKSTCVNGSIYWVEVLPDQKLLALDLHAQEWRDVGLPLGALGKSFQVANLENRLALAATYIENDHWNVKNGARKHQKKHGA
ncbi:BnaA04g19050D [Brassica napus]|uniref:BnaA04g19050D protein n=1 Tax=Brassica napus TaxID=3708 RepID=A0A078FXP3_BRANA|nr:BnaA04g19050D [Brassica napus]